MNISIIQTEYEKLAVATDKAQPVGGLNTAGVSAEALNLNVEGHQLNSPLQGFGQMWQKTYWMPLSRASVRPVEVITTWRENFSRFWPAGNRFYPGMVGLLPGDVAVINLAGPGGITGPGGVPLISTGVMVIEADEESFTFVTAAGHMLAGWITFRAKDCLNVVSLTGF